MNTEQKKEPIWRCIFLHDWGKWETIKEGVIYVHSFVEEEREESKIGQYIYQQRVCKRCEFKKLRYQELKLKSRR